MARGATRGKWFANSSTAFGSQDSWCFFVSLCLCGICSGALSTKTRRLLARCSCSACRNSGSSPSLGHLDSSSDLFVANRAGPVLRNNKTTGHIDDLYRPRAVVDLHVPAYMFDGDPAGTVPDLEITSHVANPNGPGAVFNTEVALDALRLD